MKWHDFDFAKAPKSQRAATTPEEREAKIAELLDKDIAAFENGDDNTRFIGKRGNEWRIRLHYATARLILNDRGDDEIIVKVRKDVVQRANQVREDLLNGRWRADISKKAAARRKEVA